MTINSTHLLDSLTRLSKTKKKSKDLAIYITNYGMKEHKFLFNGIKENISHYIAFIEVAELNDLKQILADLESLNDDAKAKYIFFDSNIFKDLISFTELKELSKSSECFIYSEVKAWSDSVISLVSEYHSKRSIKKILVAGKSEISKRIFKDIVDLGIETYYFSPDSSSKTVIESLCSLYQTKNVKIIDESELSKEDYDCIISSELKETVFNSKHCKMFFKPCIAIDAGINNFSSEFIREQFRIGSELIRIDNRAALSSYLISILETEDLVSNVIGKLSYEGMTIVAGGYMGLEDEIIVDNISKPTMVIGVANGDGKVKYPPYSQELKDKIAKVEELIKKK